MVQTIEITTPDGTAEAYLARPADGMPAPGVLFWMDAFGLRPQIARMVERIASWGYTVLAPNAFYREGMAEELAPTDDLTVPEAREDWFERIGFGIIGRLTSEMAERDTAAYVEALGSATGGPGPIATTGYCMGARLATRTAGWHPDRVVAVGGWHGGGLVTDEPDSPHLAIAGSRAEYAYGHADNDGSMPPEAVAVLEEALAGHPHTNEIFPDAPHGYTMADTASYHEPSALRHDRELRALLDRTLRA